MKKVLFTAFVAAALAFGMSACNNNNAAEQSADTAAAVATDTMPQCHHQCTCADTACAANNCEGCPNHGTENCCKAKAGEKCCHEGEHAGCCEHAHPGCEHQQGK